ncbi:MAG: host attachment protein [Kofleriaceae bacterium]
MYRTYVVAADTHHCRIYLLERTSEAVDVHETFVEQAVLSSDVTEHRGPRLEQHVNDFARHVVARIRELTEQAPAERVVLVAGPQMLGHLRTAMAGALRAGVEVTELPHELTKLHAHELRLQLATHALLPAPPPGPAHASH